MLTRVIRWTRRYIVLPSVFVHLLLINLINLNTNLLNQERIYIHCSHIYLCTFPCGQSCLFIQLHHNKHTQCSYVPTTKHYISHTLSSPYHLLDQCIVTSGSAFVRRLLSKLCFVCFILSLIFSFQLYGFPQASSLPSKQVWHSNSRQITSYSFSFDVIQFTRVYEPFSFMTSI